MVFFSIKHNIAHNFQSIIIFPQIPERPKQPTIDKNNVDSTKITVEWSPAPMQAKRYKVEYRKGEISSSPKHYKGGDWVECEDEISTTRYTKESLERYQEYEFCVRALYETMKHGPISPLSDKAITTPSIIGKLRISYFCKHGQPLNLCEVDVSAFVADVNQVYSYLAFSGDMNGVISLGNEQEGYFCIEALWKVLALLHESYYMA